jgi:peptidoglycan/LPS O-acetylase OafA/YrhL
MTTSLAIPVPLPGDRLAGLDGLRAIAVTLVVLFHLGVRQLPGGYVGVDVFFPISGFLITGLLLRERAATGSVDIVGFWMRRARRLLPALSLVLVVCGAAAFLVGGDVLVELRRQMLGAVTFGYNWLAIADGSSYLDATTPELLRNLWSLAVEEQFYLVWPAMLLLLWTVPVRRVRLGLVVAVAVASAVAMAALAGTGQTTRVYYGTDTHSFGLALGAALAIVRHDWPGFGAPATRRGRTALALLGGFAVVGLVAKAIVMPAAGPAMYQGGLAIVALLAVLAIASTTAPGSPLGRLLDVAPLRWVGQRSYGLYLWHWPLFVLVGAALGSDGAASAWGIGIVTLALTLVAAAFSYRFVETPIREIGLRRSAAAVVRTVRLGRLSRPSSWRPALVAAAVVAAISLTVGAVASDPGSGLAEARIRAGQAAIAAAAARAATPTPAPVVAEPTLPPGNQIAAIGDSVMLAVSPELTARFPGIAVDAVVSRQMSAAPAIARAMVDAGQMRPYLVIGLGTNGAIDSGTLREVRDIVGKRTRIVLVDVQAPRGWTPGVNAALTAFADRTRGVERSHWHDAIQPRLDALAEDQIHAGGPVGGGIYADALSAALLRVGSARETVGGSHDRGDRAAER